MALTLDSAIDDITRQLMIRMNALQQQLARSSYGSIRQLHCHVEHDRIVLQGVVPTYYLKQIVQALAKNTVGFEHVETDVEVCSGEREGHLHEASAV